MNIKDFSLNNSFNGLNQSKISQNQRPFPNNKNIKKPSSNALVSSENQSKRNVVSREKVIIKENNLVRAEDGSVFDTSAPKGTYVNLII
ncbi:MAG: hypothetical protein BWY78_00153 [Alphaproteobacteria bacterium ADurb.Bin438]|nr:MAG: hypothetical protein BWY78_00153 [Alphaproteobacteria bacterium ADurb.Bin438]